MISFGLVAVSDPSVGFLGEVAPVIDNEGQREARSVSGVTLQTQKGFAPPQESNVGRKELVGTR